MTDPIDKTLRHWLGAQSPVRWSVPGDNAYDKATAIWSKPIGRLPRAVVHCRNTDDVRSAIQAARDCQLPLSVLGGGHDWAGRALAGGIVIDLRAMDDVLVSPDRLSARVSGGVRASGILAAAEPYDLAAVTGSVGAVGMAGLTLGGGYGPLIGRFGLALDNLLAAQVVLADGRVVLADPDHEPELFWALRGGGGNFGVVTAMRHRLHSVPSVRSGMLVIPCRSWRTEPAGSMRVASHVAGILSRGSTLRTSEFGNPEALAIVARRQSRRAFEEAPEESRVFVADPPADFVDGCLRPLEPALRILDAKPLDIHERRETGGLRKAPLEGAFGKP